MSNTLQPAAIGPIGSLDAYRRAAFQNPMLSAEEERELAERWQQHQDLDAAWKLVTSHLRFVIRIARGYDGYGLPQADLIQEGNVGLMKAVKRFDPSVGVRLVSFATHWIRAEIHEYVLRNWRIVKIATTKAQRKLFFNLRRAKQQLSWKKQLSWLSRDEAKAIAEDLGVPVKTVHEMEKRLSAHDTPFDAEASPHAASTSGAVASRNRREAFAPAAYLQDMRFEPASQAETEDWKQHNEKRLADAMAALDERSRDVITRRWLAEKKVTLRELAGDYGVSAERIRQIENSAMKKLRTTFDVAAPV